MLRHVVDNALDGGVRELPEVGLTQVTQRIRLGPEVGPSVDLP
jgi:hypothetical protein